MTVQTISNQRIRLSRIAQIELEIRQAETFERLDFIAANETYRLVAYDHALIWRRGTDGLSAISGGLLVDRNAPQIVWFTKLFEHLSWHANMDQPSQIEKRNLPHTLTSDFDRWLPCSALWLPMRGVREGSEGGLILLREKAFSEAEMRVLGHIGNAYGHACSALRAPVRRLGNEGFLSKKAKWLMASLALIAIMLIPLPITVLGIARITPDEPVLITAPLNAVIKKIYIEPNTQVNKDAPLFAFIDTRLKSSAKIFEKRLFVLLADRVRAEQKSFTDASARSELGLITARLAQTYAELDRANEQLSQMEVRAPKQGVILFDNPEVWEGRPVQIGERVMLLADPAKTRLEIEIPIEDALVVEPGAEVKFFLAVRRSQPVHATLTNVSYSPKVINSQKAVFIGEAKFKEGAPPLRLGLTGTAKIFGPRKPLYYILFRKPLSALRRLLGI